MRVYVRDAPDGGQIPWVYALWFGIFLIGAWLVERRWIVSPPCGIRQRFGWPCFGCGGTRATLAFFDGRWLDAIQYNPLVTVGLTYWTVTLINFVVVGSLRRRIVLRMAPWTYSQRVIAWAAVFLANWGAVLYLSRRWEH